MIRVLILNNNYHLNNISHFIEVQNGDVFYLNNGTLELNTLNKKYPQNKTYNNISELNKSVKKQKNDISEIFLCAENYVPNIKLALRLRRITNAKINIIEDGFGSLFSYTYKRGYPSTLKEFYLSLIASVKCFDYVKCEDYGGERFYKIRDKLIFRYYNSICNEILREICM